MSLANLVVPNSRTGTRTLLIWNGLHQRAMVVLQSLDILSRRERRENGKYFKTFMLLFLFVVKKNILYDIFSVHGKIVPRLLEIVPLLKSLMLKKGMSMNSASSLLTKLVLVNLVTTLNQLCANHDSVSLFFKFLIRKFNNKLIIFVIIFYSGSQDRP